jgi:hypothetical protein
VGSRQAPGGGRIGGNGAHSANGWTQSEGTYNVYVGDSSALPGLPLQGTYTVAHTPAARQVVITAPSSMPPGQAATVQVQLTASGDQTLPHVKLALQLPQGWTPVPAGPTQFTSVAPGTAPATTFQVTPTTRPPAPPETTGRSRHLPGSALPNAPPGAAANRSAATPSSPPRSSYWTARACRP